MRYAISDFTGCRLKGFQAITANRRPARGTMRMEQRQITRARLIDASIQVFAERGFFRATVDDIVEVAGTTRSTFYLHFSSKADVLPEMLERSATHFRTMYDNLGNIV